MENKQPAQARPFWKRWDLWIILALLAVAAAWLLLLRAQPAGMVAIVSVESTIGTAQSIPLNRDGIHHIQGRLPVTLEIKDGAIRFTQSTCPDHTCEGFGWLRNEGEWALCAPAGVMVTIQEV